MKRLSPIVLAVVVSTGLLAGSSSAQAERPLTNGPVASPYEGIRYGEVEQQGSNIAWGRAIGDVARPIDQVLAIVGDYANYQDFMPNFRKSRVLAQRGLRAMVYMEVGVMKDTITLWGQLKLLERPPRGETRILEVDLVEGNIKHFKARWELTPVDGGKSTHMEFRILVDPGMPLPSSVFTNENVKAARKTVRAVRERALLRS